MFRTNDGSDQRGVTILSAYLCVSVCREIRSTHAAGSYQYMLYASHCFQFFCNYVVFSCYCRGYIDSFALTSELLICTRLIMCRGGIVESLSLFRRPCCLRLLWLWRAGHSVCLAGSYPGFRGLCGLYSIAVSAVQCLSACGPVMNIIVRMTLNEKFLSVVNIQLSLHRYFAFVFRQ